MIARAAHFSFAVLSVALLLPAAPRQPVFDVRDYGAVGDGVTKNTVAMQAAIDAAAGSGGSVYLHDGTYVSGTIKLKRNLTLYIDSSATLLGSPDTIDYPTQPRANGNRNFAACQKALIYGLHADSVTITGGGTIDGRGDLAQWIMNGQEKTRPSLILMTLSNNVTVEGVALKRSAMWTQSYIECDDLTLRKMSVDCNYYANRDGMDICDCHHVLIEECTIFGDDDAICPKSGSLRGVYDLVARNCVINKSERANGIKFGTASVGSFKKMLFENITIRDCDKAGIAVESVDGADIDSITFRNITMDQVGSPIFIVLGARANAVDTGTIRNVTFENIKACNLSATIGCPVSGSPGHPLENLTFKNLDFTFKGGVAAVPAKPAEYAGQYPECTIWGNVPAYGFYVRHAQNVSFIGCTTSVASADARPAMDTSDVSGLLVAADPMSLPNIANQSTFTESSGFTSIESLWDNATATAAGDPAAVNGQEAWVDFTFRSAMRITSAALYEDNSGSEVTEWTIIYWTGTGWADVCPYKPSNCAGWSRQVFDITTERLRLYAKCAVAGKSVSIHEFVCNGQPATASVSPRKPHQQQMRPITIANRRIAIPAGLWSTETVVQISDLRGRVLKRVKGTESVALRTWGDKAAAGNGVVIVTFSLNGKCVSSRMLLTR
jgi:polygalacturonase